MSIRDRIEDIIWDHCDDGEAFMDAADAILAALPDYAKQQARIAQLEAALNDVIVRLDDPTGNDPLRDMGNARAIARAALKGEKQ